MRGLKKSAAAVPRRAMATCKPSASASSWPVNHLTITFDTVIPQISAPMPKMAKPSPAIHICVLNPKSIPPSGKSGETA